MPLSNMKCGVWHVSETFMPLKGFPMMVVTEFGIKMLCNVLHPSNAASPMIVTELGMLKLVISLSIQAINRCLSCEYRILSSNIKWGDKQLTDALVPLNGLSPMSVTDVGMVICGNVRHPLNAY